jgi:hypothetical protein
MKKIKRLEQTQEKLMLDAKPKKENARKVKPL